MALGTPVVSTSKGAEGLDAVDGQHLLIADTPEDFARRTVELLRSPCLRSRLADEGKRLVAEKYDWAVIGRRLDDLIAELKPAATTMRLPVEASR
jgi:polysaccharide biosynthesis protein PslH